MTELDELYQELIMDHNRNPRNFGKLQNPNREADGHNPFCGDTITLHLKLDETLVIEVGFQSAGCAISKASASMMTEAIKDKPENEINKIFDAFHKMLTNNSNDSLDSNDELGDLAVMSGVSQFPTRVKCATLSWHALRAALSDDKETVKTE